MSNGHLLPPDDTYPTAQIRTYHNAGHAPMFSRFNEYLAMVKQFLDSETVDDH